MILDEDLDTIAHNIYEKDIKSKNILISGATGLIGSLMAKGFVRANEKYKLNNKIYALVRNLEKAKIVFKDISVADGLFIVENEITHPIEVSCDIDYVFHTAAVTTSNEMVKHPVELINTSILGTMNTLNFAREHNAKSVVFLSSMEVYGVVDSDHRLKENELGIIDLTSPRSSYPESKRLLENYCACFAKEFGLNVTVARLTQTFGAGAGYNDSRIFGVIARSALLGQDVILHTTGGSTHDYCYTTDAINAILTLAKDGVSGEVYNIANPNTNMSIKQMAELVAKEYGNGKMKVRIEANEEKTCFSPDSVIRLDTSKMESLGWKPKYDLKEMYGRLIESYSDIKEKGK